MPTIEQQVNQILDGTASVSVTSLYGLGRDVAMPADEYPLAEINETLDGRTCPLCEYLDGMILRKNTPAYNQYRNPSHINCRRILVDIHRDEVGEDGLPVREDFRPPDPALLDRYGHFVLDPDKYAELRIPSRPEGRDFIFLRGPAGQPGQLIWLDGLPDAVRRQTLEEYETLKRQREDTTAPPP
jgi:hypothetical protein